ncbi:zinc finger protein 518A-like [Xiphophorus maculatus]|uniref:zinc finger protein 518A-like n=1 Tax=Xiphophorus maculatus TaxID=8083 RepID=UPI000C6CE2C0|nr:zinc finger protein 518A-like [Xiphophorus maculatus]XP_023196815.1 zinc finger protein 518A-like [Xiphophorus maculatus]XP_023196816.1 zinc finger protein 518A-like [Xiphophorus maculatus]
MEDFTLSQDPNKNSSGGEEEKDEGKDLVCKHFREVNDGPLFRNTDESITKDNGSVIRKDDQTVQGRCKIQQRAVFSGKILSFGCSLCKDNLTFSPNDLLKHFRAVHQGSLPTYPCDLCDFVTNEFPALQRHRIEHRNTLVACELCNDNVQYSLLLLTRHYMMCHSINGEFKCDWCEFTTVDAGTFVQHIHHHNESHWKCSKCKHISLNEEDHHNHMKAHSGTFTFTCPICGFGTAESEQLKKHTAAVHKEEAQRKSALKVAEDCGSPTNSSTNTKLYKKIAVSQETQGMSKLNSPPRTVPSENGRLTKQEFPLEEIHHFTDGTLGRKDNRSRNFHNAEHSTSVMLQECENANNSDTGSHPNANGLTVLMVKNKISLPPNCTTKVMGFKIVDGKKHLVLKVIPTAKQNVSSQSHLLMDGVGPLVSNPVISKTMDSIETEQYSECKGSTSKCLAVSPRNGSLLQMDRDDVMAVKVKIEEEETSVCHLNSTPYSDSEQINPSQNRFYSVADEGRHSCESVYTDKGKVAVSGNSDAANFKCDGATYGSEMSNTKMECEDISTCQSPLNAAQKTLLSKTVCRETVKNSRTTEESILTNDFDGLCKKNKDNFATNTLYNDSPHQISLENRDGAFMENGSKICQQIVKRIESSSQLPQPFSVRSRVEGLGTGKGEPQTSNKEVFTFHNYSKEMFSSSPVQSNSQNLLCTGEYSEQTKKAWDPSQFSLRLTEPPEHTAGNTDGDGEVDECIANDNLLSEENGDSVLQDFNIIKIEEDGIPISTKQPETKTSLHSIESFVKEHSNAIITRQLNRERTELSHARNVFLKQAKKPLQILQLPGGKQPVLLRATNIQPTNNKFAMPVQVTATPGFKLLTSSPNPQVSLSCMKQQFNNLSNTTGVMLTPKANIVGISSGNPQATEKGTVLSSVCSGGSTSSNHYFINSSGFKRPVLLSRTLHSPSTNTAAKAQPTCYFVQRSIPSTHNPSKASFKLPGPQLSVNSQPVLAGTFPEKSSTPQTGRQAYLLRYVSPSRSSLFGNKQEAKNRAILSQSSECPGNKVIFKIVSPTAHLNTTPTSSKQPLLLASRPQGQCFLVSANKTCPTSQLISVQNNIHEHPKEPRGSPSVINGNLQPCEANRLLLAPRLVSQRKRHKKTLFDELPANLHKVNRLSNKVLTEKDNILWSPAGKEVERMLRLAPHSTGQQIKYPCRGQPVVVLNHPDADIPEVMNIMKAVNRYKGAVTKVALSQKTVQALAEFSGLVNNCSASSSECVSRPRPVLSSVRERFLLKLKLRKKNKKKYEVVKTLSTCGQASLVFDCWFCGRLFNNQEDWIGHGQRHLMEATRDWNKLF